MTRRRLAVVVLVVLLAIGAAIGSSARVIVANVDGPLVYVHVDGLSAVSVPCPGSRTLNVPLLNLLSRDVVVTDTRNGEILRKTTVWRDTVVLIRGTTVLTGEPGASYGPAPTTGCL
jgi:hypothetical protein